MSERSSSRVPVLVEQSRGLVVESEEEYESAVEMIRGIRELRAEIEATFEKPKSAAHAAHRAIIAAERPFLEHLDRADALLRERMIGFVNERQAAADRETEKNRTIMLGYAQDDAIRTAANLIARGQKDEATALLAQPIKLKDDPTSTLRVPRVPGVSIRRSYKALVTNPRALLAWAAENDRGDLFAPVTKALDQLARERGGEGPPPGVRFVPTASVAIGKSKA